MGCRIGVFSEAFRPFLLILTVLLATNARAQEVEVISKAQLTIPNSGIANQDNPPCGDQEPTTSDAVMKLIREKITDKDLKELLNNRDVSERFKVMFGMHDSKSVCRTLCAYFPYRKGDRKPKFRTYMSNIPGRNDNGWTAWDESPERINGRWEWGASIESSVSYDSGVGLFCTTGKNWSHDNDRTLKVEVGH